MNYGKITSESKLMPMPNPVRVTVSNPTETQKAQIAELDNWLPVQTTEPPEYDPDTEYLEETYEEQTIEGVKWAVQVWTVKPIPTPETEETEQ